jgi:hypothetical protein
MTESDNPRHAIQQWVAAHTRLAATRPDYRSFEAWLATYGRWWNQRHVLLDRYVKEQSRECYLNAWQLRGRLRHDSPLSYCEGIVFVEGMFMPVWHGWLSDAHGNVVDPSVNQQRRFAYLGLEFDRTFAHRAWIELRSKELIGIVGNAWALKSVNVVQYLDTISKEREAS